MAGTDSAILFENKIIKLFYKASGKINTSVIMRHVVFVLLGIMMMLSSVYDLILTPCMLENPRVSGGCPVHCADSDLTP